MASRKRPNVARRGWGKRPSKACATAAAPDPETRNTPIPPLPGGVAMAAMVSLSFEDMPALSPNPMEMERALPLPAAKRVAHTNTLAYTIAYAMAYA